MYEDGNPNFKSAELRGRVPGLNRPGSVNVMRWFCCVAGSVVINKSFVENLLGLQQVVKHYCCTKQNEFFCVVNIVSCSCAFQFVWGSGQVTVN